MLNAIRLQISTVVELDALRASIQESSLHTTRRKKLRLQIAAKEAELTGYRDFKSRLVDSLHERIINNDEFTLMRDKYRRLEQECSAAVDALYEKLKDLDAGGAAERTWVEQYLNYQDLTELRREAVVSLIDKITVFSDKRIEITFNYHDEIRGDMELIAEVREMGEVS